MARITGRTPPVAVEYDSGSSRKLKFFSNSYNARKFYAKQLGKSHNPAVKSIESLVKAKLEEDFIKELIADGGTPDEILTELWSIEDADSEGGDEVTACIYDTLKQLMQGGAR